MCGVFAYVASAQTGGPDLGLLERIALDTEQRGAHAFGFAWIDQDGRLNAYKQPGRISEHLDKLALLRGARMMIGHCRWATQGDPADNRNNHPHASHGGWIVHNGDLEEYERLMAQYRLTPTTDCDTEVLALLIEHHAGPLLERCRQTIELTTSSLVVLGLWARPARLVVARRGNPLHFGHDRTGLYLASRPDTLPGDAAPVRDHMVALARPIAPLPMIATTVHGRSATRWHGQARRLASRWAADRSAQTAVA